MTKFYIRGIALVPHHVSCEVEALTQSDAERKIKKDFKKHLHQDGDEGAAFQFEILNCEQVYEQTKQKTL